MIDFRYHLVSLISVFLALAVGIALGAGPLKEAIGDTLTGQVEQLRLEKDALRDELDTATVDLQQSDAALDSVAPALLDGTLTDRRVAVVQLGEVAPEVLTAVTDRLTQAGASVSATVQVTEAWTDPERRSFRQSLAGTLVGYLDPTPAADAGTGTELAEALAQTLTSADPTNPDVLSEDAAVMLDLLSGDAALISVSGEITAPADAIVVLSGPTVSEAEAQLAAEADEAASLPTDEASAAADLAAAKLTAGLQIVAAAQARSTGAVLAGGDLVATDLLTALRADETLSTHLSTVESAQTVAGQIAIPMALGSRISGTVGHYGPSADATSPMPPHVVLLPIERVPAATADAVVPPTEAAPTDAATADAGQG